MDEKEEQEDYTTASSDGGSPDPYLPARSDIPRPSLPLAGQCAGESSTDGDIADADLFGKGPSVGSPGESSASLLSSLSHSSSLGESFVVIPVSDSSDTDSNHPHHNERDERNACGKVETATRRKKEPPPVAPKPRKSQNMDSLTGDGESLQLKDECTKIEGMSDEHSENSEKVDQASAKDDNYGEGNVEDNIVPGDVTNNNGSPVNNGGQESTEDDNNGQYNVRDNSVDPGDVTNNDDGPENVQVDNGGQVYAKDKNGGPGDVEVDNGGQGDDKDDSVEPGDVKDDHVCSENIKDDNGGQRDDKDEHSGPEDVKDDDSDAGDDTIDDSKFKNDMQDDQDVICEVDDKDIEDDIFNKDKNEDTERTVTKYCDKDTDDEGILKDGEVRVPRDHFSQHSGDNDCQRRPDYTVPNDDDDDDDDDDTQREHCQDDLNGKDASSANNLLKNRTPETPQDLPKVQGDEDDSTEPSQDEENKLDPELYGQNQDKHHDDRVHSNTTGQPPQSEPFERENVEVSGRNMGDPQEHPQSDIYAPNPAEPHGLGNLADKEKQEIPNNQEFDGKQGAQFNDPLSMPIHAMPDPPSGNVHQSNPSIPLENVDHHQQEQQQQQQNIPEQNTGEQQHQYPQQQQQQPWQQHQQFRQFPQQPGQQTYPQQLGQQPYPLQSGQYQYPEQHGQQQYQQPGQHHYPQQHGQQPYSHQSGQHQYPQQHGQQRYQQQHGQQPYPQQPEQQHYPQYGYYPQYGQYGEHQRQQQHQQHPHQQQHQQHPHKQQHQQQHIPPQQQQQEQAQQEERGPVKTVRVEGLTKEIPQENLELYFENTRRSQGGEITNIKLDKRNKMALIEFADAEAAKRVAGKKQHLVTGETLTVFLHDPQQDRSVGDTSGMTGPIRTVRIEGLTKDVTQEKLELYFENRRRSQGGEITNIKVDERKGVALIEFADAEAAERVTRKKTHVVNGKNLQASLHGSTHESTTSNTIRVTECPPSFSAETIEMYFESKRRSNGGDIQEAKRSGNAIYITFQAPGVAERVAAKTDHVVSGVKLTVQLDDPAQHESDNKTLVVSNYQPVSAETIQLHFENKRRSGGGENEMKEEKGKIYLMFQSEEVVERVLKKCPHKVEGKTLTVTRRGEDTEDAEEDEKPRTTIKVSGFEEGCTDDSISLYFENKRKSGGGDIVGDVRRHAKKDIIYIEFEEEQVARRVVERSHTLNGRSLVVELVEPQVMYRNKVLISGVPELESPETLQHYLEGRTHRDVSQILFGEEPGEVVVSFGDESEGIDFAEVDKQLAKRPFKQGGTSSTLKASPVPQTSSVTVQNLPSNSTEDQIRLYFENKRRSGGGEVKEVVLRLQEQYAVVTFTDVKAAEAVCQREHTLSKVEVKASLCFECLGEKGGSRDPPVTRLPDPIRVEDVDTSILRYLTTNKNGQEVLNKSLEIVKAKPDVDVGQGVISFLPAFDLSSPDAKSLIKTWTKKVDENWKAIIGDLGLQTIKVNSEIWTELKSSLKPVDDKVEVFTEDSDFTILVVGPREPVSDVANSLETMRKTVQAKCDKRKTIVQKKMKIQPCQLMLLVKQGVMDRFSLDELKLNFNFETGEITITGQQDDINKVRSDIWEEVNKIKVETVVSHFTSGELEFLRHENVHRYLQKQSEERSASVAGCWERGTEGLKVFFLTDEGLEDVKRFLKRSVKETTHRLDPDNLSLLKSSKYKNLIDQLNVEYEQRLTVKSDVHKRQIVITTIHSEAGAVEGQICRFLETNCIYDKLFEGDSMKIKFVIIHCKDRVKKLETDLKDFLVSIEISNGPEYTIRVKSTKDGCPLAERELRQIVREVKCYKRELERPGLKEFLKSEDVLQQIERDIRCVIGFDDGTNFENDDVYDDPDFSHSIPFECQFDRDRKLHMVVGEMISLASDVDAVVVEVTPNLSCDSRQSWEVMQKAGDKPAQELRRYTGGQDIMEGEVFCTSPGDLRCANLIHAVGPSSSVGQKDTIVSVVAESLQEAVKKNLRSVALPSFCTESVISAQDALRAVVEGVHMFYTQTRNSSITDTYLCLETWEQCNNLWDIAGGVFGSENIRNNEEMSTGDSLHGGNRRGMGLRKESLRDLEHSVPAEAEIQNFPEGLKNIPRPRILLVEADMGVEEADVIVNSSGTSLNLSQGQVSKSLLKNAGPAIQAECAEKYPKGIKMGDIAVTKGGNMQCVKVIYHCTLPQWKNETGRKTFTNVMNALLKKAHDEKMQTMAIPALGTGNLGYSRELVANLMYETVIEFCKNTPETTINDVLFIVYPKDLKTIEAFEVEHRKYQELIGGKVPASKSEIKKERTEELEAYRAKQGYIEKFGGAMSKVLKSARSSLKTKKPAQVPSKPTAKPAQPAPYFNRQGTLQRSQFMSKPKKVSLFFYTDSEFEVSKALNKIYGTWDKKSDETGTQDDTIKQWTKEQIQGLKQLENKHSVTINIVKTQGLIKVFGLRTNVLNANFDIMKVIREIEREQKDKEFAEDVQRLVEWSFEETSDDLEEKMVPYPGDVNVKLERAYNRDKLKEFQYRSYVFDFEKWVEYPVGNPEDSVKMMRKDKLKAANENLPDSWERKASDKDMEIKAVNMNSREFSTVKANFVEALGTGVTGNIVRVDRIQSKTLFQQYQAKKEQLTRQNPGVEVEQTLWHGTNKDAAMSIAKLGFNRSYCDKDQNAYGEGVYFTRDAGYAARSQYAPADAQNKRHMFQSKVLIGSFTQGKPKMRVPPAKDESNKQNLYDSVVDDPSSPKTFVIFSDTQAYPEYLITFM